METEEQDQFNTEVDTNTSAIDSGPVDNKDDNKTEVVTSSVDKEVTSSTDANNTESTNATTINTDDLVTNLLYSPVAKASEESDLQSMSTLEDTLANKAILDEISNKASQDDLSNKATIEDLRTTVDKLRNELDNAKSEVAVADYLKENLVQTERQKESLQEEMATLQALLIEATQGQEQESQLMKVRKKAKALESENQDLRIQLRMLEGRRNSVRGGGVGMGSGMPKSPMSSSGNLTAGMDKESLLGNAAVISDRTKKHG